MYTGNLLETIKQRFINHCIEKLALATSIEEINKIFSQYDFLEDFYIVYNNNYKEEENAPEYWPSYYNSSTMPEDFWDIFYMDS
jgi:hypothetical protein